MTNKTRFRPAVGLEDQILSLNKNPGWVYFASDSGRMFLDIDNDTRISLGGSGISILYGNAESVQLDPDSDTEYIYYEEDLEDTDSHPRVNDIILNTPTKSFYRIIDIEDSQFICTLVGINGGGGSSDSGGTSSTITKGSMTVTILNETNILNGGTCKFSITALSGLEDGEPIDADTGAMKLTITYTESGSTIPYYTDTKYVTHNQTFVYDASDYLHQSVETTLVFNLSGSASNTFRSSKTITRYVTTTDLYLNWLESTFSNNSYFDGNSRPITVAVNASSSTSRIYDLYFDDLLVSTQTLSSGSVPANVTIKSSSLIYNEDGSSTGNTIADYFTHGTHIVSAKLSLETTDNKRGSSTDLITKEVALKLEDKPLIWLDSLDSTYYEYDTVFVPFRVYDPKANENTDQCAHVYLYKNGADVLNGGYKSVSNDASSWETWEISDLSVSETANYTIRVGTGDNKVERNLSFTVLEDPRHMAPADGVVKSLYSKGRSNTASNKSVLSFGDKKASFIDFNWYNNGWITENKMTSLRISNGAKLKIPMGLMTFGADYAHTIEFRMKVSNIQDYSTLTTNYTRYKYSSTNWTDDALFAAFQAQKNTTGGITNYDAYLTKQIPIEQAKEGGSAIPDYDQLEFNRLQKDYNLENAMITYKADDGDVSSIPAICFGSQDGFFSNGQNSVTVNFVENEVINVALVSNGGNTMNGDDNLMKVYLNGMLTGVARSSKSKNGSSKAQWSIGNTVKTGQTVADETYLTFSSNACDIDLYNIRVYDRALSVVEILKNYAYDNTDIQEWDLSELYTVDSTTGSYQFSYNKMIEYNNSSDVKTGRKLPIMPYIVFTTDDTDTDNLGNLPWFKTESADTGVSHYEKADMTFVNTYLDNMYDRGLLTDLAKEESYEDSEDVTAVQDYYLHHCPSWTSTNIDLGVQGTSSEFYPRRNYKAKTKVKIASLDENGAQSTKTHEMVTGQDENGNDLKISYIEYKTDNEYEMIPHTGPFKTEYEEYAAGIEGAEARRLSNFYYDNKTVGTNKFTLKVDFMESSGSYNMGLANMVNNAYSHHPLSDYAAYKALVKENREEPTELEGFDSTTNLYPAYDETKTYYYKNHKGNMKVLNKDDLKISTDADKEAFRKGPYALAKELSVKKVLGAYNTSYPEITDTDSIQATIKLSAADNGTGADYKYWNKWYITEGNVTYEETTVKSLSDYRTSVQGFPALAFHQTKTNAKNNGEPVFIGRYNMLLDKGADDAYGFKVKKTLQNFVKDKYGAPKAIEEVAECWEFENNSRGFCSFRDPWNRRELSFAAPDGAEDAYTSTSAPIVADSFEYRYNVESDYIDLLTHLDNASSNNEPRIKLYEQYGIDVADKEKGREKLLELYSNWEKAVKWVWSTATDATIDLKGDKNLVKVPLLGEYKEIELATLFESNKYYTYSYENGSDVYTLAETFDPNTNYYKYVQVVDSDGIKTDTHPSVKLITEETDEVKIYQPNKYYTIINKNYILCEDESIDEEETYYELIESYEDATSDEDKAAFAENKTDFFYVDTDGQYRRYTDDITDESLVPKKSTLDSAWKLSSEIKYGNKYYNFDTQEYRLAKFKNELTNHFNFEYLVTYFVITEALECYDSRGKNCMMASWGPQTENGDYIWYPIFYDLDTQLGINNTGIPSFEYDIDATEEGSFSTNDSVLWNNLYSNFKNSISQKYQQLKGTAIEIFKGDYTNTNGKLNNPPFSSVDKVEQFYSCDPDLYGSASMEGERPLLALNLDEQYKYIAITDSTHGTYKSRSDGKKLAVPPIKAGFISTDINAPLWDADASDSYFYALQGSRSMSRRQFLTNRFNYLDSWLNIGNYARAGKNRIRSRVSANSYPNTSDKWIEGTATNGATELSTNVSYYKEDGVTKTHMFDGEYWITMTPARNMYVTVGTDAANFPSLKYSGTPVKFKTTDLENGVRKSGNYREQLYYIYGLDQMKSLGDLSKLYFQEFALEGSISKLTDLNLGYDGLDENDEEYFNKGVNDWTIPGSSESASGGMPLLKEANFSNITFKNEDKVIDLSSCAKLENFRATGSNITGVNFAEGVVLNTLYLPNTIKSLNLVEARMLTNIIEKYETPTLNTSTEKLEAKQGLYIKDLTDFDSASTVSTGITTLIIKGGNFNYDSYKLLQNFYNSSILSPSTNRSISLTDVQWSPYILVETDEDYSSSISYFVDDGHFGLLSWADYKENHGIASNDNSSWINLVNNSQVYRLDEELNSAAEEVNITSTKLLTDLLTTGSFAGLTESSLPNITGIIYINNDTAIDEGDIQQNLQLKFPGLTFFFKNVSKGFAARFVIKDANTGIETLVGTDKIGIETYKANKNIYFTNPLTRTETNFDSSTIDATYPTKDFLGWSTSNSSSGLVETYDTDYVTILGKTAIHNWSNLRLSVSLNEDDTINESETTYDYTFYAILETHMWTVSFYAGTDASDISKMKLITTESIGHSDYAYDPKILVNYEDSSLGDMERYKFLGWTQNKNNVLVTSETAVKATDVSSIQIISNLVFYAILMKEDVRNSATDLKYFKFDLIDIGYTSKYYKNGTEKLIESETGYRVSPADNTTLAGKITIPTTYENMPVISIGGFYNQTNITGIFWYGEDHLIDIYYNNVYTIGGGAFEACTSLKTFQLPTTLKVIGNRGFYGCTSLNIDLTEATSLVGIGEYAFSGALLTTKNGNGDNAIPYIIPGTITTIGASAFYWLSNRPARVFDLQFGSSNSPCQLSSLGTQAFQTPIYNANSKCTIYGGDSSFWNDIIKFNDTNHYFYDPNSGIIPVFNFVDE